MNLHETRSSTNSTSSILIGNHHVHSAPIIVSSSGSINGPKIIHTKTNLPTSHKTMPPPPPPTNMNNKINPSTSSNQFNGRSENETSNVPLTQRFSKTRFQFSRKVCLRDFSSLKIFFLIFLFHFFCNLSVEPKKC